MFPLKRSMILLRSSKFDAKQLFVTVLSDSEIIFEMFIGSELTFVFGGQFKRYDMIRQKTVAATRSKTLSSRLLTKQN